jgi:hypothetical protein
LADLVAWYPHWETTCRAFRIDARHRLSLQLLSTYRKVYKEAVSKLYANNVFELKKTWELHDHHEFFEWPARFLELMDARLAMIRTLVVNMDYFCPPNCTNWQPRTVQAFDGNLKMIDFTSLLRSLWDR